MRGHRFIVRAAIALALGASLAGGALAGEIRTGETAQVRANSIWFQEAAELQHWQQLRKAGDAAAFQAYEHELLSSREAWQFLAPLTVEILGYDRAEGQVSVRMKTPGRMLDTEWLVDAGALAE